MTHCPVVSERRRCGPVSVMDWQLEGWADMLTNTTNVIQECLDRRHENMWTKLRDWMAGFLG